MIIEHSAPSDDNHQRPVAIHRATDARRNVVTVHQQSVILQAFKTIFRQKKSEESDFVELRSTLCSLPRARRVAAKTALKERKQVADRRSHLLEHLIWRPQIRSSKFELTLALSKSDSDGLMVRKVFI